MSHRKIVITEKDMMKLSGLIESLRHYPSRDHEHVGPLEDELDRADVVTSGRPPRNVVTMNAWVTISDLDTGHQYQYQIVFPRDADLSRNKISVLAPIGTALLGYGVGSEIEWNVPGGLRRLRVDRVWHDAKPIRQSKKKLPFITAA
jgi:regulator of nucleoside diphosphate kinase